MKTLDLSTLGQYLSENLKDLQETLSKIGIHIIGYSIKSTKATLAAKTKTTLAASYIQVIQAKWDGHSNPSTYEMRLLEDLVKVELEDEDIIIQVDASSTGCVTIAILS